VNQRFEPTPTVRDVGEDGVLHEQITTPIATVVPYRIRVFGCLCWWWL